MASQIESACTEEQMLDYITPFKGQENMLVSVSDTGSQDRRT